MPWEEIWGRLLLHPGKHFRAGQSLRPKKVKWNYKWYCFTADWTVEDKNIVLVLMAFSTYQPKIKLCTARNSVDLWVTKITSKYGHYCAAVDTLTGRPLGLLKRPWQRSKRITLCRLCHHFSVTIFYTSKSVFQLWLSFWPAVSQAPSKLETNQVDDFTFFSRFKSAVVLKPENNLPWFGAK